MKIFVKIRHIKQFLLVVACLFLAGFNYFSYANADDSRNNSETKNVCDKSIDSDCDKLTNAEEKLYGTDANNRDSDGDGYSDGVEVESGYDPMKPAPEDKLGTVQKNIPANENKDAPLTESFSQNLSIFLSDKKESGISASELKSFVSMQIDDALKNSGTDEDLPEIDISEIKILKQDYAKLSESERKQKEKEDARKYVGEMLYALISNSPDADSTIKNPRAFLDDLLLRLEEYSSTGANSEYFSDLGNRLELFLSQADEVVVPETMADLHIKFLRISKGVLSLRQSSLDSNDPMERILLVTKANAYADLFFEFLQNDLASYFSDLNK